MTNRRAALGGLLVAVLFAALVVQRPAPPPEPLWDRMPRVERKAGRDAYLLEMLRDPATGAIPEAVRERELEYAATLPVNDGLSKNGVPLFNWTEAGPNDVGGRTRALAVNVTNPNVILTGGVSGGIWKSTDGGVSWRLVTSPGLAVGVQSLAQDPRAGQRNVWYAATGEFSGASQVDRGGLARIYGSGLYKSIDGGETWTVAQSAGNVTRFDSDFDFVTRVEVSPVTGTVFACSVSEGVLRSDDGFASYTTAIGGFNNHIFCDVAVGTDGSLVAYLGIPFGGTPPGDIVNAPGLYRSADDGRTWAPVAAGSLPAGPYRPVIALAPSNPNVGYAYVATLNAGGTDVEARVYRFDLAAGTAVDRTASLPNFGTRTGYLNLQGGYNMALAVKPDDENFVVIGATDLFRTRDGFASPITNRADWIGGYTNAVSPSRGAFESFPEHHPDQHVLVFDPANPNRLWNGHDGGVTVLADVRSAANPVEWGDRNRGYNVTQFYHVSMPAAAGDMRSIAGAQDNGSVDLQRPGAPTSSEAGAGGDGAYSYMGTPYRYVSSQFGNVIRRGATDFAFVTPDGADEQLFIHPFAIDPANENVMYYPDGDSLWRNNALVAVTPFNTAPTSIGWTKLPVTAALGYRITALDVANAPTPRLYYGAYSRNGVPRLYRLDNPQTAPDGEVEIALPGAPVGAFIHDVAANPANGDELLVVLSNYNVRGLYHSLDGGATWTVAEGNLEGNASLPGPSLRSASILNFNGKKVYLVGTSTGLYATTTLAGDATVWEQQDPNGIGGSVVEHVTSRPSDGRVLAATHGRGLFNGMPGAALPTARADAAGAMALLPAYPNPARGPATFAFTLGAPARVTLRLYDALGREVATVVPDAPFAAGRHTQPFDVGALAPGSYVYRLESGRTRRAAVLTVVR